MIEKWKKEVRLTTMVQSLCKTQTFAKELQGDAKDGAKMVTVRQDSRDERTDIQARLLGMYQVHTKTHIIVVHSEEYPCSAHLMIFHEAQM